MVCFTCDAPATWQFVTTTRANPGGLGERGYCETHIRDLRHLIEHAGYPYEKQRNLLSRILPLESVV